MGFRALPQLSGLLTHSFPLCYDVVVAKIPLALVQQLEAGPIWERLPGESPQAYARFLIYRDMPPGQRSLRKLGFGRSQSEQWSKQHNWVQRCAEWDLYMQRLADVQTEGAVVRMRSRHADLGMALVNKAVAGVESIDHTKLAPDDVVTLAKTGVSIERAARGLASEEKAVAPPPVLIDNRTAILFPDSVRPAWAPDNKISIPDDKTVSAPAPPDRTIRREKLSLPDRVAAK